MLACQSRCGYNLVIHKIKQFWLIPELLQSRNTRGNLPFNFTTG